MHAKENPDETGDYSKVLPPFPGCWGPQLSLFFLLGMRHLISLDIIRSHLRPRHIYIYIIYHISYIIIPHSNSFRKSGGLTLV